ncbi:hypothetical protein T11_402 [Trichinella zimbabwensis]|uniref:Uncharacterized protein n=1 Tax=Trichinella zimbabwensis TaxID=268475 RepID=A0A0V1HIL5_9BILA|nr:hypothetical protein T11_402 [Trichinella zimbabwensis]
MSVNFKSAGDSLPKRKGTEIAEYVVQIRSLEVHTGLRKMKLDLPNAKQQRALSVQLLPQDVSIPVGNLMWRFVRIRLTDMKSVIHVYL